MQNVFSVVFILFDVILLLFIFLHTGDNINKLAHVYSLCDTTN